MGAIFYSYGNNGMFTNSVGSTAQVASIDLFDGILGKENMCIITGIGVGVSDIVQFFPTFDDFIHYYWFGKGVGSITCEGMLFLDCDQKMPGLHDLLNAIGARRGKEISCFIGSYYFIGVMLNCNISFNAEPETIATFTLTMGMIDHNLPPGDPSTPQC